MGIESFYIECICLETQIIINRDLKSYTGNMSKKENDFIYFLFNHDFIVKEIKNKNHKYTLNNQLFLDVLTDNGYFQGFILEGCFSYYEKNLKLFLDIISCINNNFSLLKIKLSLQTEYVFFSSNSFNIYKQNIADKYKKFCKNYKCNFKSLPGIDFYNKYRRQLFIQNIFDWFIPHQLRFVGNPNKIRLRCINFP